MSNTIIAIGGCHVAGYKVGDDYSFVNNIVRNTGLSCIHKVPNYQIKKIVGIREKLNQYHPDIALLQLGNYEFHASLKKLFEKKKKKSKLTVTQSNTPSVLSQTESDKSNILLPIVNEPKAGFLIRNIITPLIWRVLVHKNKKYLKELKQIVLENPSVKFIILSPIPCVKDSDRLIRRRAGNWYHKLFSRMSNVTYIDLSKFISTDKKYFIDPAHLNKIGHRILAKAVTQNLKLNKKSLNQAVAV